MPKVIMDAKKALEWVLLGLERGNVEPAIDILRDVIGQWPNREEPPKSGIEARAAAPNKDRSDMSPGSKK